MNQGPLSVPWCQFHTSHKETVSAASKSIGNPCGDVGGHAWRLNIKKLPSGPVQYSWLHRTFLLSKPLTNLRSSAQPRNAITERLRMRLGFNSTWRTFSRRCFGWNFDFPWWCTFDGKCATNNNATEISYFGHWAVSVQLSKKWAYWKK